MSLFKLIGSDGAVHDALGMMTPGIGFPLAPVDAQVIDPEASQVLAAESTVTQTPSAQDTPMQVSFGPAQNGATDSVQLAADGTITFNRAGLYFYTLIFYLSRTGTGGLAEVFFRGLKNGVQIENPLGFVLGDADETVPVLLAGSVKVAVGDAFRMEMIYETTKPASLQSVTSNNGWGTAPSARARILQL